MPALEMWRERASCVSYAARNSRRSQVGMGAATGPRAGGALGRPRADPDLAGALQPSARSPRAIWVASPPPLPCLAPTNPVCPPTPSPDLPCPDPYRSPSPPTRPRTQPAVPHSPQANLAIHLESASTTPTTRAPARAAQPAPPPPRVQRAAAGSAVAADALTSSGVALAAAAWPADAAAAAGGVGTRAGASFDAAAARSLLARSRDVFLAATSGLRRRVQSGYQRSMANTLTSLRLMHLLEDNSLGKLTRRAFVRMSTGLYCPAS
jgi:hypothetical protein